MEVYIHGGKCCGIKHIYGLGWLGPDSLIGYKRKTKGISKHEGARYMNSTRNFYTDAAPAEKYIERFDRIVAFIKKKRPRGVIEVVLGDHQIMKWGPFLKERGFKQVTVAANSNSGGKIYIFHLITE